MSSVSVCMSVSRLTQIYQFSGICAPFEIATKQNTLLHPSRIQFGLSCVELVLQAV